MAGVFSLDHRTEDELWNSWPSRCLCPARFSCWPHSGLYGRVLEHVQRNATVRLQQHILWRIADINSHIIRLCKVFCQKGKVFRFIVNPNWLCFSSEWPPTNTVAAATLGMPEWIRSTDLRLPSRAATWGLVCVRLLSPFKTPWASQRATIRIICLRRSWNWL